MQSNWGITFEKRYLRGLAHGLRPVVLIGKEGLTDGIVEATEEGLSRHELIKVKFNEIKGKDEKETLLNALAERTEGALVGTVGHTAVLYRPQTDPEKRRVRLPAR